MNRGTHNQEITAYYLKRFYIVEFCSLYIIECIAISQSLDLRRIDMSRPSPRESSNLSSIVGPDVSGVQDYPTS